MKSYKKLQIINSIDEYRNWKKYRNWIGDSKCLKLFDSVKTLYFNHVHTFKSNLNKDFIKQTV